MALQVVLVTSRVHGHGDVPNTAYELAHCVVCRHAESELVADVDAMRRELDELWEYHEARLRPGTPAPVVLRSLHEGRRADAHRRRIVRRAWGWTGHAGSRFTSSDTVI
jgi:hypothetical protein